MLFFLNTLNKIESYKIWLFVLLVFFPLTRNLFSFFISLFVQNMSLCAQHSSRLFTDRLIRLTSFSSSSILFFLVLFSKCTANHPPLTYFALALTEFQDHAGSPGETRLAYFITVGRWSFLALYAGVLSNWAIIFVCCNFSHSHQGANRRPRKGSATAVATDRSRHDRAALTISTKNHLLVCVYARFFWSLKKKGTISYK